MVYHRFTNKSEEKQGVIGARIQKVQGKYRNIHGLSEARISD